MYVPAAEAAGGVRGDCRGEGVDAARPLPPPLPLPPARDGVVAFADPHMVADTGAQINTETETGTE